MLDNDSEMTLQVFGKSGETVQRLAALSYKAWEKL